MRDGDRWVIQLLFEHQDLGGGTSENREAREATTQEMFSLGVNGV